MPRFARNDIKTNFFHVMTQGINKNYIFNEKNDIIFYIKQMKILQKKSKVNVIAYCIMNNHTHMLIKTEDIKALSSYMQRLNTIYALYYNKNHNRVGYVFRDRYRSEGIFSQRELYNCIRYIYNNPVKAHIVDLPEKYEFSNYNDLKIYIKNKANLFDNNYKYIEYEDDIESDNEIINLYIERNKLSLQEIIEIPKELKKLILYLKNEKEFSYRKIERLLKINRRRIKKIVLG